MEEMHEKCGIVGVIDLAESRNIIPKTIEILQGLEHRGGLAAGIAWYRKKINDVCIDSMKGNGPIRHVFARPLPKETVGTSAIGHTRYATCGSCDPSMAQPFLSVDENAPHNSFAFGFNGNINNYRDIAAEWGMNNTKMMQDIDTEVIRRMILHGIQDATRRDLTQMFATLEGVLDGAFNIVMLQGDGTLVAYRDSRGIRPLSWGIADGLGLVASEDSAMTDHWYNMTTEHVKPGELLTLRRGAEPLLQQVLPPRPKECFFERIYFGRSDAKLDSRSNATIRFLCGKILAQMDNAMSDNQIVVPIPDSGLFAAEGYKRQRRLPRFDAIEKKEEEGAGRTFTAPDRRKERAEMKYAIPRPHVIDRENIILVDDSLVRGTTMSVLINKLRQCNPREIHLRIPCPPLVSACYYGIDFPTLNELIVRRFSDGTLTNRGVLPTEILEQIADVLKVDSIRYLPDWAIPQVMMKSREHICMACVDKKYPTPNGQALAILQERECSKCSDAREE